MTKRRSHGEGNKAMAPRRKHFWRGLAVLLALLFLTGIVGRALMPWALRNYVNRTLDQNPLYAGTIGDIDVRLWRGAYTIEEIRISKTTGNVPVPFFKAPRVDLSIQWNALWHGKVVGRIVMQRPEINFVDAESAGESQSGAGGAWLQVIQDLFPFKINQALVQDGSVHFRTFTGDQPVDVYLSEVEGSVDNLTNIRDETAPFISTVQVNALAMDQARFEYKMTLDPFSYRPTFKMGVRLLGLNVTRVNDLALHYGKFDFQGGWFDLVIEATANQGQIQGYVKPLFRDLQVLSLREDLKDGNVLQFFWQALVGGITELFENQSRDQFGTLIPFTADLTTPNTSTDFLAAIGNVLRNAFVRAYLPNLESGGEQIGGLKFSPARLEDPISVGGPS